ncbi:hypothetical protein BDR04DRAFT_1120542 [Suillus decipiens]|nr:hypothetical protein BDR04DRAFT_1120542 [Suillus decipiens]
MLQLPMGFVSQSLLPLQTASSLHNHASGMLQDGFRSVIHTSFPNDPLPLWVLLYWVSMSYALKNQHDWHASHDWVLARLDAIPGGGPELGIIDKVLDILESLSWDTRLMGFASSPIDGHILDTMIAIVVQCMQASDDEDLHDKWWKNYKTNRTFSHLHTIGSVFCKGTLQCVLFPININNIHWAIIKTLMPFVIGLGIMVLPDSTRKAHSSTVNS